MKISWKFVVAKLFVFRSFFGKFIAGFCALSGVFILTLPIPIVVNSFANFYKNRLWRNEVELRKQERLRLKAIQERQVQKYQFIEVKILCRMDGFYTIILQLMAKTVGFDQTTRNEDSREVETEENFKEAWSINSTRSAVQCKFKLIVHAKSLNLK